MSEIILSAGVRQNLLSLQDTAALMSKTQNRLATGKKVNTALDNPSNYFTSQGLSNRANDLNALLALLQGDLLSHARAEQTDFYPAVDRVVRDHGRATATMEIDHEKIAQHVTQAGEALEGAELQHFVEQERDRLAGVAPREREERDDRAERIAGRLDRVAIAAAEG